MFSLHFRKKILELLMAKMFLQFFICKNHSLEKEQNQIGSFCPFYMVKKKPKATSRHYLKHEKYNLKECSVILAVCCLWSATSGLSAPLFPCTALGAHKATFAVNAVFVASQYQH